MIHVQLNPERILYSNLEVLDEVIMDISMKRFGAAVREVFGGTPPDRNRKVYLCEFQKVLRPKFYVNRWRGSLFGRAIDDQYLPILTPKQLVEQDEKKLQVRAESLLKREKSVRTSTEFVQLCTDFLQLFNLSFESDCSSASRQKPYSRRDLHDVLRLYLY